MKLISIIIVVFDVVWAGGDDSCSDPTIRFRRSDILVQLRSYEAILRYLNSTTFERINDTITEPSLSAEDFLQRVISDFVNGKPLYVTAGIKTDEVDSAINFLTSYINTIKNRKYYLSSFPSNKLKNINFVQTTVFRSKESFADVLKTVCNTIAPEIPIPIFDLLSYINNPTTAPLSFPLSCIYDDLKYLIDLVSALNSGIEDFGNSVLAMIYVTQ